MDTLSPFILEAAVERMAQEQQQAGERQEARVAQRVRAGHILSSESPRGVRPCLHHATKLWPSEHWPRGPGP